MAKTCDGCNTNRSKEWSLSVELAKNNRRMFAVIMAALVVCLALIFVVVWCVAQMRECVTEMRHCFDTLSEFEIVNESVDIDAQDGGDATYNYIGHDGDVINGKNNGKTQNGAS